MVSADDAIVSATGYGLEAGTGGAALGWPAANDPCSANADGNGGGPCWDPASTYDQPTRCVLCL
jgi:hypothetical protein